MLAQCLKKFDERIFRQGNNLVEKFHPEFDSLAKMETRPKSHFPLLVQYGLCKLPPALFHLIMTSNSKSNDLGNVVM